MAAARRLFFANGKLGRVIKEIQMLMTRVFILSEQCFDARIARDVGTSI